MTKGLFITLEGIDGSGKTTAMSYIKEKFEKAGYQVHCTREPGGTPMAEKIRSVLFDPERTEELCPLTEVLLFSASRAQHIHNVILPKVNDGWVVISDRYCDSMMAYQGAGRKLQGEADVVNQLVTQDCMPVTTFYFHVSIETASERAASRGLENYMDSEGRAFKEALIGEYDKIYNQNPGRVCLIDANGDIASVQSQLNNHLDVMIAWHKAARNQKCSSTY